ncbi:MAG: hypothetical protein LBN00_09975 [Oscillospiraceae bacterium]|jgi:hypothetical protein|nr:hypothetical protein [Oscillospiraceae bacterium]
MATIPTFQGGGSAGVELVTGTFNLTASNYSSSVDAFVANLGGTPKILFITWLDSAQPTVATTVKAGTAVATGLPLNTYKAIFAGTATNSTTAFPQVFMIQFTATGFSLYQNPYKNGTFIGNFAYTAIM